MGPGDEIEPLSVTPDKYLTVRYAGASGDFNPIHWSDRVATSVGLPGVIAHGMLTMALAARAVEDWAGGRDRVDEYFVRFAKPVVVPDDDRGVDIEVSGVTEATDDGRTRIDISCTCEGKKVLGMARALVRRSERQPPA